MSMSPPTAGSRGGAGMWEGGVGKAPSPPVSSERRAGIGCKININDKGELFVREVIAGGPAALSCEIANGDVLLSVDGVSVTGETPEEVARRIVGPEGQPITMAFRIKRRSEQGSSVVEKNVTLVRQPPFAMSERLIAGQVGLGVELAKVDGGHVEVRKLLDGGSACLSARLMAGDVITAVDGRDISQLASDERPKQLLGTAYTRLTLSVARATPQGRKHLVLDLVRTVPLQGEYLLKYAAYRNALAHAILPPVPPQLHRVGGVPETARAGGLGGGSPQAAAPSPGGGGGRGGGGGWAAMPPPSPAAPGGAGVAKKFSKMDIGHLDSKFQRVMDPSFDAGAPGGGGRQWPAGGAGLGAPAAVEGGPWGSPVAAVWPPTGGGAGGGAERRPSPEAGAARDRGGSGASSLYSSGEERRMMSLGTDGGSLSSVDGMLSRSSTASVDSIAMSVRLLLAQGEGQVDSLRTVEGREATFGDDWVHGGNPRLLKGKMAAAGFIHTPDADVQDKVTCVYCGLELGMWEPGDDPWVEHHEGAPGCSFWRRSSIAGERISKEVLFTGYGSPYHSFQRSAGQDMQRSLAAYAAAQQGGGAGGVGGQFDRTLGQGDSGQTFAF